jgi:cytochrome c peroxidase
MPYGIDNILDSGFRRNDDAYHNIGTPRNPEIPETFNEDGSLVDPDLGLAGHTGVKGQNDGIISICTGGFNRNCDHRGFFKTTTMRNVDKRKGEGFIKAYTHNGWFKSLESIVHFYNTAFLGGSIPFPPFNISYEATTAFTFGVTRCPDGIETERDALANNCWPAPAYANPLQGGSPTFGAPLGRARFGGLQLTLEEEAAIVAYLKTLTDEYTPKQPKPYK